MARRVVRADGDAAKRVRRAKRIADRMIGGLERIERDIDRGRLPEGRDDPGRSMADVVKWIGAVASEEMKLADYEFQQRGGVPGRDAPMDLCTLRKRIMGRLDRLAAADRKGSVP